MFRAARDCAAQRSRFQKCGVHLLERKIRSDYGSTICRANRFSVSCCNWFGIFCSLGYAICYFAALQPPENHTTDERFETVSNVKICFIRGLLKKEFKLHYFFILRNENKILFRKNEKILILRNISSKISL